MLGVGRPEIGGDVVASETLFFALVLHFVDVGIKRSQLGGADQDALLSGRRIQIPEFSLFTFRIAMHVGQLGTVGAPRKRLGTASGQPSGLVKRLDGERLGRRGLGGSKGEGKTGKQAKRQQILSCHEATSNE